MRCGAPGFGAIGRAAGREFTLSRHVRQTFLRRPADRVNFALTCLPRRCDDAKVGLAWSGPRVFTRGHGMNKDVRFIDTTFRDGSQSLWASGLRAGMMESVAEKMGRAGVAGGAGHAHAIYFT